MQKVLFKKWIPKETAANGEFAKVTKPGTNCWSKDYIEKGIFHCWGVSYEEFESGPGNYTVAIVELPDGTIKEVLPSNLKFVDKP